MNALYTSFFSDVKFKNQEKCSIITGITHFVQQAEEVIDEICSTFMKVARDFDFSEGPNSRTVHENSHYNLCYAHRTVYVDKLSGGDICRS